MQATIFKLCVQSFDYPDVISKHVTELLDQHNFSININRHGDLNILVVKGIISYVYRHDVFRVPILIKIYKSYPFVPPIVYIINHIEFRILPNHPNVDENGLITVRYLDNWGKKSKLVELLNILVQNFKKKSPLIKISHKNMPQNDISIHPSKSFQLHSLSQSKIHSQPQLKLSSTIPIFKNAAKYLQIQWHEDNNNIDTIYHGEKERIFYHFQILESWLPTCELLADKIILHKQSNVCMY